MHSQKKQEHHKTESRHIVYSLIQLRLAKVRWVTGYKRISCLKSWFCAVLCLVAQSCPSLCDPVDCSLPGSSVHGGSPGKNTGVGCHVLLQEIFATQGWSPGLLHCRQILNHLNHQGSPRILGWVAYPFARGSSWPRSRISFFCIAGGFFTSWATRETQSFLFPTKWKDSWPLLEEESRACQHGPTNVVGTSSCAQHTVNPNKLKCQSLEQRNVYCRLCWVMKNWCFHTVALEKTLESPLNCKEVKPVNPKGNEYSLEGLVESEAPILWPPDEKSWLIEKTLMLGKIEGGRRRGLTEDEVIG